MDGCPFLRYFLGRRQRAAAAAGLERAAEKNCDRAATGGIRSAR